MNRTGKIIVSVILVIIIVVIVVSVVLLTKDDDKSPAKNNDVKSKSGAVASDSTVCNAVGMFFFTNTLTIRKSLFLKISKLKCFGLPCFFIL